MNSTVASTSPERLRADLAAQLIERKWIRTPAVAAAIRAVPRHLFVPDTVTLAEAYADDVVITQRDPAGQPTSSVSAPWLVAYMLEQAGLQTGGRVLEVGSGGYNAALIADVVGPNGKVVTVDIDPAVISRTSLGLDRAGYGQVTVVHGDGEFGHQPGAPYDAVVVTVETADLSPAWLAQLVPDGVLVVPLRLRGMTRCLTLRRRGDHLVAKAALQCGFVSMQGDGHRPTRRLALRGNDVVLTLEDPAEVSTPALVSSLDQPRVDVWSPVTITMQEGTAFESLHLWLGSQPRPYGTLAVDRERAAGLVDPQDQFVCPTLLSADSFAYLAMRKVDGGGWQFGAHGFGPAADGLAADLRDLIMVWDRDYRHGAGPEIAVHPDGTVVPAVDTLRLLVGQRNTTIVVTWPTAGGAR